MGLQVDRGGKGIGRGEGRGGGGVEDCVERGWQKADVVSLFIYGFMPQRYKQKPA